MTTSELFRTMPMIADTDAPLGRDAGRDNARHCAAVTIFSLTGVAIIAVAGAWVVLRERPAAKVHDIFENGSAAVSLDMPVLRPRFDAGDDAGPGPGSFTFFDDATGTREVVEIGPRERAGFSLQAPPTLAR